VYVYDPSSATSTSPCAGFVASVTVRPVPVEPARTPWSAGTTSVPSAVADVSAAATTGVTVTATVPVRPVPWSFAVRSREVTVTGCPAAVVIESSTVLGCTVTRTMPVEVLPSASVAVYVKVSGPDQPSFGVYVYEPSACRSTVPWRGSSSIVALRPVPWSFASTPADAVTVSVEPAVAVAVSAVAWGPTTTTTQLVVVPPAVSTAS
jgi:hypothetical protein